MLLPLLGLLLGGCEWFDPTDVSCYGDHHCPSDMFCMDSGGSMGGSCELPGDPSIDPCPDSDEGSFCGAWTEIYDLDFGSSYDDCVNLHRMTASATSYSSCFDYGWTVSLEPVTDDCSSGFLGTEHPSNGKPMGVAGGWDAKSGEVTQWIIETEGECVLIATDTGVVSDRFEGTSGVFVVEGFTFQFDITASW